MAVAKPRTPRKKPTEPTLVDTDEFGGNTQIEELIHLKQEKLKLLEAQAAHLESLPHLYGFKLYPWMRDFFETRERDVFLTAANQVGKSSIQIRKMVDWATDSDKWDKLWKRVPRTFWYLYPSQQLATQEFEKKWVPDFLPRGTYKLSKKYGWKAEYQSKNVHALHFNSGVTIYFKAYSQDVMNLQAGTVDYVGADEEMPSEFYDEINFRRMAVDGYFSMVFTATRGEEFWRCTMEEHGELEKFKGAWKRQVSLFDCIHYEDGTDGVWNEAKIARAIASCKSEAEVQRRVYGKFIKDENLKYPSFSRKFNVVEPYQIPRDWHWYGGTDLGAGGDKNHPSTITFVAVSPDYTKGACVRGWKGSDEITTMQDVLEKFIDMREGRQFHRQFYDYHAKDFSTYASRIGESFEPAEKSHEIGEQIINVLFKNKMLDLFNIPELYPLMNELATIPKHGDKRKLVDDFADALRYTITKLPWNWSALGKDAPTGIPKPYQSLTNDERRREELNAWRRNLQAGEKEADWDVDTSLDAWSELYDP